MSRVPSRPDEPHKLSLVAFGLAAVWAAVEWILLTGGTRLQETIVGAFSLILIGLFGFYLHRVSTLRISLSAADLWTCRHIPADVATDTVLLIKVLFLDLLSVRRAGSYYRVCGFATSKEDPRLIGRRVLTTAYTSASPNSIVIGIDYMQSRMLVHQVERRDISALAQELGARP